MSDNSTPAPRPAKDHAKIRVSKMDAARRQLDCAIQLWAAEGDPVSIHTLACASHQIIHDINRKRGGRDLLLDTLVVKDEYQSQWRKTLRKEMNFFKHAETDPGDVIEFMPDASEAFMTFSILGLEYLGETRTELQHVYMLWVFFHCPDKLLTDAGRAYVNRIPLAEQPAIRALSRRDFIKLMLTARTVARLQPLQ